MENTKKIKIFLAIFYVLAVTLFLYFIFSKFTLQEITSYDFLKNNRDTFINLRKSNLVLISFIFLLFTIIWILAAGFGTPIIILAGFIFGKWIGTMLVVFGMTIGSTGLYVFASFFLKNFIREKFLNRYSSLENKFKKSEFFYLLIYRFVGGIPFAIANVLPCIFDVKRSNYFFATLIGLTPGVFVVASLGSGFEKIIDQNAKAPSIVQLITSPDIYIPLIAFFSLIIITILVRKIFFK